MANVTFNREEFEKALDNEITKEIEEKINLLGTPLEKLTKNEIEIEVFPNRPDLLSMQGYVRALRSFLGKSPSLLNYKVNKPAKNYKIKVDSSVKSTSRPYTVCAIVKNLKFNEEKIKDIVNFQEKLHSTLGRNRKKLALGIYPLEKIKLPIKFQAKRPAEIKFTPLGSKKEMTAYKILKNYTKGKEYAHLLKEHKKFPVFTDAKNNILSMPPVINSQETGKISEKTKEVFIEVSGYDLDTLLKTLNIVVTTLADMGGKIFSMKVEDKKTFVTPNLEPEKIKISLKNANKLLGLELKDSDLQKLLQKMGYKYKNKIVTLPAWRVDILHETDIIEDIAIAYGYDKFTPEIPKVSTIGKETSQSRLKRKISEVLIGLGLLEISSYHLIKEEEEIKMKINNPIRLQDAKTKYKILRQDLLTSSLRIISENKDNEYPQKIFEIGKVFHLNEKEETGIKETTNLIICLTPSNFTEIKQHLNYIMKTLSVNYEMEEKSHPFFIDGRTGKINLNKKEIGYIGEVHPSTLKKWNIKLPLAILEINLDKILKIL